MNNRQSNRNKLSVHFGTVLEAQVATPSVYETLVLCYWLGRCQVENIDRVAGTLESIPVEDIVKGHSDSLRSQVFTLLYLLKLPEAKVE